MSEVTLELCCARCGQWLVAWIADLGRPWDEQCWGPDDNRLVSRRVMFGEAWHVESPGMWRAMPDGTFSRWLPAGVNGDEEWNRVQLGHGECRTVPQARLDGLEEAAAIALRHLYDTRTPLLRTTVDTLLKFAP